MIQQIISLKIVWLLSLMRDRETVLEMLNTQDDEISDVEKAKIFANLKMKDSMYYYIDKIINDEFVIVGCIAQ